jgi:choline dehydrogenase-like flavoprotein
MPQLYDAVVVGSGAAGGMAATELSLQGLKVLLLEAGPKIDVETQPEMFRAAGVEILGDRTDTLPPGWSIHEAGTARMGNDPKTSALNKFSQCHDVRNLFVVDAACFVSASEKIPP